jgi:hypothetical protein
MHVPDTELLWWAGCPSTDRALDELRGALQEAGISNAEIRMTEIRSEEDAQTRAFVGSPTILVDGEDVAPPGEEPAGLNCRVYRRPDGTVSPTPGPESLREALRRAQRRLNREEVTE